MSDDIRSGEVVRARNGLIVVGTPVPGHPGYVFGRPLPPYSPEHRAPLPDERQAYWLADLRRERAH